MVKKKKYTLTCRLPSNGYTFNLTYQAYSVQEAIEKGAEDIDNLNIFVKDEHAIAREKKGQTAADGYPR